MTLGNVLASARKGGGLTPEDVASTWWLEEHFVTAPEKDPAGVVFVDPVFGKGYLGKLAALYELRYEELLALYVREAKRANV